MSVSFRGTENYVASPELMGAVDIAVALQKPLLIKGEPGTGKTVLAQAVAEALGKKLIIWNVKSTTKAQDGLYVYDVVQRLYDSQFGDVHGLHQLPGRHIMLAAPECRFHKNALLCILPCSMAGRHDYSRLFPMRQRKFPF